MHEARVIDVVRTIHPDDHMWKTGKDWYFTVGQDGLRAVQRAVSASWLKQVRRLLDLACGHGRVARYLRHGYPDAELFFCDINESGAAFCAEQFQGKAIVSKPELTNVQLPDQLDVIWVGSLFTHLDRSKTERWLCYMCDHLGPHGVLVATFHGAYAIKSHQRQPFASQERFLKILAQCEQSGYGYEPYPHLEGVGVSICKASAIVEIASNIAGIRIIGYHERGWANNHDVLAVTKHDRLA